MSKVLSLKMQDDVYMEAESVTKRIHVPRNAYINAAVRLYNQLQKRALLKKALVEESRMVRENSMEVLELFDALEDQLTSD